MTYRLKQGVELIGFLKSIRRCGGDVWLRTREQDVLNLKSALSQYVAVVLAERPQMLEGSTVECSEEDAAVLGAFLQR